MTILRQKWLPALLLPCVIFFFDANSSKANTFAREYMLKAGFMVNFLRFASWPEAKAPKGNEPFKIGICGNKAAARIIIESLTPTRKIAGHPVMIKRATAKDLLDYHLVFFPSPLRQSSKALLPLFQQHHVLTIGENDDFLISGGVINFSLNGRKIAFDINQTAALNSKIVLNAKVMQVAGSVINKKTNSGTKGNMREKK